MSKSLYQTVAEGLCKIKEEEQALKVRKKEILSMLPDMEPKKGTVTLKGETLALKVACRETISYDEDDLMEILEEYEDFDDYFTITAKEKKKEVDNLIKTGCPMGKALEAIRVTKLSNPAITVTEL